MAPTTSPTASPTLSIVIGSGTVPSRDCEAGFRVITSYTECLAAQKQFAMQNPTATVVAPASINYNPADPPFCFMYNTNSGQTWTFYFNIAEYTLASTVPTNYAGRFAVCQSDAVPSPGISLGFNSDCLPGYEPIFNFDQCNLAITQDNTNAGKGQSGNTRATQLVPGWNSQSVTNPGGCFVRFDVTQQTNSYMANYYGYNPETDVTVDYKNGWELSDSLGFFKPVCQLVNWKPEVMLGPNNLGACPAGYTVITDKDDCKDSVDMLPLSDNWLDPAPIDISNTADPGGCFAYTAFKQILFNSLTTNVAVGGHIADRMHICKKT